jgi:coatomer protein complex subunit epsilon
MKCGHPLLLLLLLLLQVGLHLGKNTARYASQLKVVAPQHPMALRAAAGEELFDKAAAAMA